MLSNKTGALIIFVVLAIVVGYVLYLDHIIKIKQVPKEMIVSINGVENWKYSTSSSAVFSGTSQPSIVLPGPDATKKDLLDYYNKVNSKSISATSVDIIGCNPTPAIVKFKKSTVFEVFNSDSVTHTFTYRNRVNLEIPAKGKKSLTIGEAGIYPYSCDDLQQSKTKIAGFLMVTSQ